MEINFDQAIYSKNYLHGKYSRRHDLALMNHTFYSLKRSLKDLFQNKKQLAPEEKEKDDQRINELIQSIKTASKELKNQQIFNQQQLYDDFYSTESYYDSQESSQESQLEFTLYKNDQIIIKKLRQIFYRHFKNQDIFMYGGLLRDRAFDLIHDKKIQTNDYDFIVPIKILYRLQEKLIDYGFYDVYIRTIPNQMYDNTKVLYAKYNHFSIDYELNFRTYPNHMLPSDDFKLRDFTVNNLTLDVMDLRIINKKQTQRAIDDIQEKTIDIINSFDHTFQDQEARLLRALVFVGKGFKLHSDLEKQLKYKILKGYFNLDMEQGYLQKQINKLMQSEYLGNVILQIDILKIHEIFFLQHVQKYIDFFKLYQDQIVFQFQLLSFLRNKFHIIQFQIYDQIINLTKKLLIPTMYLVFQKHKDNKIHDEIFDDVSYSMLHDEDASRRHGTLFVDIGTDICFRMHNCSIKNTINQKQKNIYLSQYSDNLVENYEDFKYENSIQYTALWILFYLLHFDQCIFSRNVQQFLLEKCKFKDRRSPKCNLKQKMYELFKEFIQIKNNISRDGFVHDNILKQFINVDKKNQQ